MKIVKDQKGPKDGPRGSTRKGNEACSRGQACWRLERRVIGRWPSSRSLQTLIIGHTQVAGVPAPHLIISRCLLSPAHQKDTTELSVSVGVATQGLWIGADPTALARFQQNDVCCFPLPPTSQSPFPVCTWAIFAVAEEQDFLKSLVPPGVLLPGS